MTDSVKSKLFAKKHSMTNLKLSSLYLPEWNQENHKYPQVQTENLLAQIWKESRQSITWLISEITPDSQSPGPSLKPFQITNLLAKIWKKSGQPISWPKSETSLDNQSPSKNLKTNLLAKIWKQSGQQVSRPKSQSRNYQIWSTHAAHMESSPKTTQTK